MSDYRQKMHITKALSIVNSMYTVRRKDTRATTADALETVLYDYYRKSEKLDKLEQIHKLWFNPLTSAQAYEQICEVLKHE